MAEPTGLLIIRAWVEMGPPRSLRTRIRLTSDVAAGFERELTLVDIAAISSSVETWLRNVLDGGPARTDN